MRRRVLLASVAVAASGLAGCESVDDGESPPRRTVTAAPVPTDRPTPESGPPADLSELGVDAASELGDRHWRTLSSGPHGFDREAVVFDDGEAIRRMHVRVRASAAAETYRFVFDVEDTDRYPSTPAYPYVEIWDDGTAYQRFGREDAEYAITENRAFDAPSARTAERYRIFRLFDAFSSASIERVADGFEVTATDLRVGYEISPRRFRLLSGSRNARLEATVKEVPFFVEGYDLSLRNDVSGRAVDIEERLEYRRLDAAPTPPSWVETAKQNAES